MCTLTRACPQLRLEKIGGACKRYNITFPSVLFVYTSYDNMSIVGDEELFSRLIPTGVLF